MVFNLEAISLHSGVVVSHQVLIFKRVLLFNVIVEVALRGELGGAILVLAQIRPLTCV